MTNHTTSKSAQPTSAQPAWDGVESILAPTSTSTTPGIAGTCIFCGETLPVPHQSNWDSVCRSPRNPLAPDSVGNRHHAYIQDRSDRRVAPVAAPQSADANRDEKCGICGEALFYTFDGAKRADGMKIHIKCLPARESAVPQAATQPTPVEEALRLTIEGLLVFFDCHETEHYFRRAKVALASLPAPASATVERFGFYVASKTKHAAKWKAYRDSGVPIISTWIDEAGIGETKSFPDLWRRCVSETRKARALIVYAEDGDELKGALIEVGAALASNTPVFMVGNIEAMKTARNHPLVRQCGYLEQAFELAATRSSADTQGEK